MSLKHTQAEHNLRITHVIDHIYTHIGQDVSMQTLARLAHYSPFHLQKLFRQIIGETPKQYSLQLQVETAFHLLIIHPHRSVREIALESGFSSPAVFSRAMKNYFGHSPEQLRNLSHREQMKLLHAGQPSDHTSTSPFHTGSPEIRIVRKETITGIYCMAPFDDHEAIRKAFQTLTVFAGAHSQQPANTLLYGILTPHQRNTYRAFLALQPGSSRFPTYEIKGGIFATFTVSGDLRQTNKAAHYFYRRWLPASGYKIAGIAGFETFSQDPAKTPYYSIQRHIHIPIEPAC